MGLILQKRQALNVPMVLIILHESIDRSKLLLIAYVLKTLFGMMKAHLTFSSFWVNSAGHNLIFFLSFPHKIGLTFLAVITLECN